MQEHRQRAGSSKSGGFTIGDRLSSQLQQLRTESREPQKSAETDDSAAGTETDAAND